MSPPRKKRTADTTTFSLSPRQASRITSTGFSSVHTWRVHSSRVILTAQIGRAVVRSDDTRLYSTVCTVRLSLWFFVRLLALRRSDTSRQKSSVRSVLLGVCARIGNSVCASVAESITSLRRSRPRLPTILSRSSACSTAWCCVRIAARSPGNRLSASG